MKIMFIAYHDIKSEARSQDILKLARQLGDEVILFSPWKPFEDDPKVKFIQACKGKRKYFCFIKEAIKAIKDENPDILILHDNYTAAILRWLYKQKKDIFIIYDTSELYIDIKPKSLKQLIALHMNYFEKKYLKYANIVIAANNERAEIMKNYFHLKKPPIVFDNIHRIEDKYDINEYNRKYGYLFNKNINTFYIAYAGGIGRSRMTFELAEVVGKLGDEYQLIILGNYNPKDKKNFDLMIKKNRFSNIAYLGFVPRDEWKYILSKSHISVVAFSQDTINNIYCASGKLYESLFEGKPVLTSTNPPLKRLCDKYKIGVSTNDFLEGILELKKNYEYYCKNVKLYINTLNYERRIEDLARMVKKELIRWKGDI